MKKIIAILVVLSMAIVSCAVAADNGDYPTGDCAWDDANCLTVPTSATITGGSGGENTGNGNGAPIIKCKWEYDALSEELPEQCDPCEPCTGSLWLHDACCCIPGLQVRPILYGNAVVDYFAIVTDPEGVDHVENVYADIWHPDGSFKYQIKLNPVGFDAAGDYDKTVALDIWDHAETYHSDLIKINDDWVADELILDPDFDEWFDIWDELNEELAYLYVGTSNISYCQPGGWYYVGVRAHDYYDNWCDYLYNRFWYIPTAGIDVDFSSIDYGTVAECTNKWVGGNQIFLAEDGKPTVRNIANTPVNLYVHQDDMDFGMTGMSWNVEFDARLSADGQVREYDPYQVDLIDIYGDPDDPLNKYSGVRIPGTLPLCTEEKLDFSIHVLKGFPGLTYTGNLTLCAYMDMDSYIWTTPDGNPGDIGVNQPNFVGNAPLGVPQQYPGPAQPGPQ